MKQKIIYQEAGSVDERFQVQEFSGTRINLDNKFFK